MILSNDGLVAFHYRSYGTFFLHKNRLHNIHRGFTHYKYYRATKIYKSRIPSGLTESDGPTFYVELINHTLQKSLQTTSASICNLKIVF